MAGTSISTASRSAQAGYPRNESVQDGATPSPAITRWSNAAAAESIRPTLSFAGPRCQGPAHEPRLAADPAAEKPQWGEQGPLNGEVLTHPLAQRPPIEAVV